MDTSNLPSLLIQAAKSAAEADGLAPPPLEATSTPPPSASPPSSDQAAESKSNDDGSSTVLVAALAKLVQESQKQQQDKATSANAAANTAMERARNALSLHSQMNSSNSNNNCSNAVKQPYPAPSAMAVLRKAPPPSQVPTSSSPLSPGGNKKKGPPMRRGKWTTEEEGYANRLIQEFKAGLLPLTDGTTLRTFLSKLLNCDPMRISKKFVGSNCIGKQVFRRRTADINRLTPEQIQQSRVELSELERRFLERVAQTNRVKSSGVTSGGGGPTNSTGAPSSADDHEKKSSPPPPPWLQPPMGYQQGTGAAMAAAALSGTTANQRAAAAGRALLGGTSSLNSNPSLSSASSRGSAGLLAMADLANSRSSLFHSFGSDSANNILHALSGGGSSSSAMFGNGTNTGNSAGLSGSAMAQIAHNASAARLASLTAAGSSMNNLLLKSGLSRDQLSQLAREGGMSSASLSNMMDRQSSFDALMSLDLQSLQSIDNLANLIQSGSALPGSIPQNGMKNADFNLGGRHLSNHNFSDSNLAAALAGQRESNGAFADLANARRLASIGRMESLLRSLSSQNVNKNGGGGGGSNANFNNLLQNMQNNLGQPGGSANSLFGNNAMNNNNNASALSLANLFRNDSSTGLTALRMQDGLNQRNTSVDDFLSLVAAGDIPHQDPSLLNMSLMQQQQQQQQHGSHSAASLLQHQILQAQAGSNSALANAFARSGSGSFGRDMSAASLFSNGNGSAASLLQQHQAQQQARAALAGLGDPSSALKRKLMELEGAYNDQVNAKR